MEDLVSGFSPRVLAAAKWLLLEDFIPDTYLPR